MTRISAFLIVICVFFGAFFSVLRSDVDSQKSSSDSSSLDELWTAKMPERDVAIYACRDIARDSLITADCLEQRDVARSVVPMFAVSKQKQAIGRKAKFDIKKGEIVRLFELEPPPDELNPVVTVVKSIPKGSRLEADAVEEVGHYYEELPESVIPRSAAILGKKATRALKRGQLLTREDIEPY